MSRTITPFTCISDVVCGENINVVWGNSIRNLGKSAFERGNTVLSRSYKERPLGGFGYNFLLDGEINLPNGGTHPFQVAVPNYHCVLDIFKGNENNNTPTGTYVNDFGIHGQQYIVGRFLNTGYNKCSVLIDCTRGAKFRETIITDTNSDVYVMFATENNLMQTIYKQHFQLWYCVENPSGSSFPPIKTLIFDDTNFPSTNNRYVLENDIDIPLPVPVGTSRYDWLIWAVWNEALYTPPLGGGAWEIGYARPEKSFFVFDTQKTLYTESFRFDGLHEISVDLYKQC